MSTAFQAPVSITRVCGHSETETMRYRGRNHLRDLQSAARKEFCAGCRSLVSNWMAQAAETDAYELELPELTGSVGQIKWARDLRAKAGVQLLPVMQAAADHGGKTGAAVWQALYALMRQSSASFWIDDRHSGYCEHYVLREAAYFAMSAIYDVTFTNRSIYGRWKKNAPYLIDDVKRACPVSLSPAQA
ncbi:hypothetical protein [Pseudomonas sp.]|uniref:hypothetical protein n=1 Tax=Pseudomonas sp. TaxID=306 RepID=UPI00290BCC98|nr:hypothetical protein [Pseudomonas sp.]MDU4254527.1 hypothetical protein [Pseudomonas sp.]